MICEVKDADPPLVLHVGPPPTKRETRAADPFRWRLVRRVGQLLFWRYGVPFRRLIVTASPTERGALLLGWYLPGNGSFRIHLSADRGVAVLTHCMQSKTFSPSESNARLADVVAELLADAGECCGKGSPR